MATEAIIADIGALYKRLFNHRPLIQNEVHYFVKEFETKREDADFQSLRDSNSKADEMYSVFLNEMMCSNSQFKAIQDKAQAVQDMCESILSRQDTPLQVTQEEKAKFDLEVEDFSSQLKLKEEEAASTSDQEITKLKVEIQDVRGARAKMRSIASSVSSSITIFPPGTPSSSPEEELLSDRDERTGEEATLDQGEGQDQVGDESDKEERKEEEMEEPELPTADCQPEQASQGDS